MSVTNDGVLALTREASPVDGTSLSLAEPAEGGVKYSFSREDLIAPLPVQDLDAVRAFVDSLSDTDAIEWRVAVEARKEEIVAQIDQFAYIGDSILWERMKARGAKEMPHPLATVEIKTQYGPYEPNVELLLEAKKGLKPVDAAKLTKFIPAHQPQTPAPPPPPAFVEEHYEPASVAAILGVRDRYAGSLVATLIEKAMPRKVLGEKFIFEIAGQKTKRVKQFAGTVTEEDLRTQADPSAA